MSPISPTDDAERTASLTRALLRELARMHGLDLTRPAEPRLVGRRGMAVGIRHVFAESGVSALVGRGLDCDIVLLDTDVSRVHARVDRRGELVSITDLAAKNGTRVDGVIIAPNQPHVLRHGAIIEMGGCALALEDPAQRCLEVFDSSAPYRVQPATLDQRPSLPVALTMAWLPRMVAAFLFVSAMLGLFTLFR